MGDLEGIQRAFQRRVFLIQSKKAAIVAASLESFFRRPEKGLASAERSRRLTSVRISLLRRRE
jgi:hypothetical protein